MHVQHSCCQNKSCSLVFDMSFNLIMREHLWFGKSRARLSGAASSRTLYKSWYAGIGESRARLSGATSPRTHLCCIRTCTWHYASYRCAAGNGLRPAVMGAAAR